MHPNHTGDARCRPPGLNGRVQFPQPKAQCQISTEHKQTLSSAQFVDDILHRDSLLNNTLCSQFCLPSFNFWTFLFEITNNNNGNLFLNILKQSCVNQCQKTGFEANVLGLSSKQPPISCIQQHKGMAEKQNMTCFKLANYGNPIKKLWRWC